MWPWSKPAASRQPRHDSIPPATGAVADRAGKFEQAHGGTLRSGRRHDGVTERRAHGGEALKTDEFSLYVMTANKAAWACYKKLGFHMEPYPHNDPHLDNCVFMVAERPAP